ncbi:hypothetical protein BC826DRAFT_1045778 [Russula brevipes]|nr:hypothetical protein BC826DRAFT_1045778 [Russula brevipes]
MADTPPTNVSRLSTPLSALHQLPEESEGDSLTALPPLDNPAALENPMKSSPVSSEASDSQLTSSDKLAALPSHIRSSPAGRSAVGSRPNSGSLEGLGPPSTLETRFAQSSAPRPAPISHSVSDSVAERGTPSRQRISFDSEKGSSTSPRPSESLCVLGPGVVVQVSHNTKERIYPPAHTKTYMVVYGTTAPTSKGRDTRAGPPTHVAPVWSRAPPRAPLPLRAGYHLCVHSSVVSLLGRAQSREEPFIPINPFRLHAPLPLNPFARCFGARRRTPDVEAAGPQYDMTCACVPLFGSGRFHNLHLLALDTLPRQLYLHSQLRLPSLYFSRVARIFEDAARIIDACELGTESVPSRNGRGVVILPFPEEWVPPNVSPALARFKRSWENFSGRLNVLSALLLSAILTLFQVPDAAIDPLTRTAALCSLISALMSLSFGITYIIRFGTMRSMYRASRWAEEAQKSETAIFWNVWVLLALPGIWLAWSVLAFLVAIMSFVWRTGAEGQSNSALPRKQAYGPRIGVTCQLLLGLVYFAFVIRTFRNYGESGRKARVVRRLTDVQIELETRGELEREREREGERNDLFARTRENEDGTRDRGRRRADGSLRQKEKPPTNKLGLSGMDRKPEVTVTAGNGGLPVSDSFSAMGI